jgi:cell division septation protein DedD
VGPAATPDELAETARAVAPPGAGVAAPDEAPLDDVQVEDAAVDPSALRPPSPPAPVPSVPAAPAAAPVTERWAVQLGSFASRDNAEGLLRRLTAGGVQGFVLPLREGERTSFRVRAGPVDGRAAAERLRRQLELDEGIRGMLVRQP